MRQFEFKWTAALAGLLTSGMMSLAPVSAQTQAQPGQQQGDSVVVLAADSQGLAFLPAQEWPPFGTFWEVRNSLPCLTAPLPFPPSDPNTQVYALGADQFLVDETAGAVVGLLPSSYRHRALAAADYAAIVQSQVVELQNFIAQIQARQLITQLRRNGARGTQDSDGPPLPGEGGEGSGTNDWQGTVIPKSKLPGTNDLWLEVLSVSVSNATTHLVIHLPWDVKDGVYDLFSTTNIAPAWWSRVLRCEPGQTNLILTNFIAPRQFFMLGLTNDADGGGMSDAWEGLLGLDPTSRDDDRPTPLVGISTLDSVAVEQDPTNTASFLISRLGGHMNWPLTVALQLSGTATLSNHYTLDPPLTLTGSNALVTIPAGTDNLPLTLTPLDDHLANGTMTATLTLTTNGGPCDINPAHASATAWILEQYTYTYTTVTQFNLGVMQGLEAVSASTNDDGHLQFKTNLPPQFPYINVACSDRGTVARINTSDGMVIGEYRTAPLGLTFMDDSGNPVSGQSPSRTTVDQYGNVWVANRFDRHAINGTNYGSIVRIGLIVSGTRYQKNLNGSYSTNPHGHYVSLADAAYNTCADRDGDGYICTSAGLADILPWNNGADADSDGGVSTAEDEAITEYTRVPSIGTRTIAVDKFNDIWVGGHIGNKTHLKVSGLLALPVPNSAFDPFDPVSELRTGGYGGVIDSLGNLWSSENEGENLLWLAPTANNPPQQGIGWQHLTAPGASAMYGIAVDPLHPYIWQTTGGAHVFRWHTNGTPELSGGKVVLYPHSDNANATSQGLAVDATGHVWVAHHKEGSHTIGHLDTNGLWLGNVELRVSGLWAEYFDNTSLAGSPLLTNVESPVDFSWTTNWPACEAPTNTVPTNAFSVRWSGLVQPLAQGEHVFYVSAEAGAAYRLTVNGSVVIDNWTHPATNPGELAGTNWLATNIIYGVKLEYAHFTNGAQVALSWVEPGTSKGVIPAERLGPFPVSGRSSLGSGLLSGGATGISVDAAGKIWAGCFDSDTTVRIDPNAGPMVVTPDGLAHHVGLVDMVVDLGDGTWHPDGYKVEAHPYNYSDMTGFSVRVVNPSLKPLKGYWMTVHDSGNAGQLWNKVSWTAPALTNGCSSEVYVRASDARWGLSSEVFVPVTNNVPFPAFRGRFIEVRLGMTRDNPSKQPALYDLTLSGVSSGFIGDYFLYGATAVEGDDGEFWTDLVGAEPVGYQWFLQYPWETNMTQIAGATNSYLVISNVDSWVGAYVDPDGTPHWTLASVLVTNGNGESLWLGPNYLDMLPRTDTLPATNYPTYQGPATRYPITNHVFGLPTNFNSVSVTVSLRALYHSRSADLSILLVSPLGKQIMLMSTVGGNHGVEGAIVSFVQAGSPPVQTDAIPSWDAVAYGPSNYGGETQMPRVGADPPAEHFGPYSTDLGSLAHDDPNGLWKLYVYDRYSGAQGHLYGSWQLSFWFH